MGATLRITRLIVLSTVLLFSVIVLGLSADLISLSESFFRTFSSFEALAVATSALTLLALIPMIVIDLLRAGAFTSWVVVEIPTLFVLWVLWLSSGAAASADTVVSITFANCDFVDAVDPSAANDANTACREYAAIQAFSYLNWIILMVYTIVILVFATIGATRGHRVWTGSVGETQFLAPRAGAGTATGSTAQYPMSETNGYSAQGATTHSYQTTPFNNGTPMSVTHSQNGPNGQVGQV